MITKNDLMNMPLYQPFYGPAEAPEGVAWDIFWAGTVESCDLEPFNRLEWHIPGCLELDHVPNSYPYPEPEIDGGREQEGDDFDDLDACLCALNEGFTLVKVSYGEPGEGYWRILVCAHKNNPNPKISRDRMSSSEVGAMKAEFKKTADEITEMRRGETLQNKLKEILEHAPKTAPGTETIDKAIRAMDSTLDAALRHFPKWVLPNYAKDDVKAAVESMKQPKTKYLLIQANISDEYADGPNLAVIELSPQLIKKVYELKAVRDALGDPSAAISISSDAVWFFRYYDSEDAGWSFTCKDTNVEVADESAISGEGLIIDEPEDTVFEQASSANWYRLNVGQSGIDFEAGPKHADFTVSTNYISYERLEELLTMEPE